MLILIYHSIYMNLLKIIKLVNYYNKMNYNKKLNNQGHKMQLINII